MAEKIDIPKEWLIRFYVMQDLSSYECAEIYGCSASLIRKKLAIYGIKSHSVTGRAHEVTRQMLVTGTHPFCTLDRYGDKNPAKDPQVREKIRLSKLGSKNWMHGRHGRETPGFGKISHAHGSWYVNPWSQKRIWLRSTWEKRVADYLFQHGIRWTYEAKTFEMGDLTYTPDFYLPDENKYIEVKGWMSPQAKAKIETFRRWNPDVCLEIWDSDKVVSLGILSKHETKIKLEP